ncbi:MAG: DUF4359 domain-containing protein [Tildeniella nuda ZEHNDER 1965/U140]|jgi:hypothetical protein|nr:DUF4359 domain-containing protein [Tildeniella nuda ZEHNDER 1965/U140]
MVNHLKRTETVATPQGSMKTLRIGAIVGGCLLAALGGALAVTNPGQEAYNEFATQAAIDYLNVEACAKAPTVFGLQTLCQSELKSNQSKIKTIIADGTQRQNFVVFSLYTTDLSLNPDLPSYHVESVGVLGRFIIYKTQKR